MRRMIDMVSSWLLRRECWRRGGIRIDEHLKIDHESHRCGSEFRSCVNAVRMPHEISTYLRTKSVRTAGTTLKINLPCEIRACIQLGGVRQGTEQNQTRNT